MQAISKPIVPWYQRPEEWPFCYVGTPKFTEKSCIFHKEEGVAIPMHSGGYGGGGGSMGYCPPVYFVYLKSHFGELRIEVSHTVYELLKIGDSLIVTYRRARWTGALKGEIAR